MEWMKYDFRIAVKSHFLPNHILGIKCFFETNLLSKLCKLRLDENFGDLAFIN
jgi:hypothetical protein